MNEAIARLPASIRIAGFDFTIRRMSSHESNGKGRYGECSTIEQTIYIQENIITNYKAVDTFLHEVLHALYWAYGVDDEDKEERIVGTLSSALMTCHRDNPWLALWIDEALRG